MSWVFLTGKTVYKLKKPVRFPYLDFSTLERREGACRAELELNRRLAYSTYLDVVPLRASSEGLSFSKGKIVDWLVVMRQLDSVLTLESLILTRSIDVMQLDRLGRILGDFYHRAKRIYISPASHIADWDHSLSANDRILLDPKFALPAGVVSRIHGAQRRFLADCPHYLTERVRQRQIVDSHGDLRPEH
ncbi:MAG: hypothetical protein MUO51_09970, partial [Woeseiaceae bacterium]|nr:hypothetical protein [Woeseiaceae bacterium]